MLKPHYFALRLQFSYGAFTNGNMTCYVNSFQEQNRTLR